MDNEPFILVPGPTLYTLIYRDGDTEAWTMEDLEINDWSTLAELTDWVIEQNALIDPEDEEFVQYYIDTIMGNDGEPVWNRLETV